MMNGKIKGQKKRKKKEQESKTSVQFRTVQLRGSPFDSSKLGLLYDKVTKMEPNFMC